jgi:hypothetical protein
LRTDCIVKIAYDWIEVMAGRPFSWLGNHITSADVPALRSFCISSWRWTVLRLTIYVWGIKGSRDEERAIEKE